MAQPIDVPKYGAAFLVHKARNERTGTLKAALVKLAEAAAAVRKIGFENDAEGQSRATLYDAIAAGETVARDKC